jgi:hypothetical protein
MRETPQNVLYPAMPRVLAFGLPLSNAPRLLNFRILYKNKKYKKKYKFIYRIRGAKMAILSSHKIRTSLIEDARKGLRFRARK